MAIDTKERIKEIIQDALVEQEKKNPQTTEKYTFKGERISLPVINLNLDHLTLNPQNHRLTGQFGELKAYSSLITKPRSEETQNTLSDLLAKTDDFQKLKGQLQELGQRDPGLITREGLLVNGNTRFVALKQLRDDGLNPKGMDVAVLPSDATDTDIINIEMELQMLKLVEQKYSFTNELLFLEKFRKIGKTDSQIILAMGWRRGKQGEKKVAQHFRVLDMIKEIREMASNKISYSFFDTKKTHFFDLDKEIELLKHEANIASAEKLKYLRFLVILMNISKDHVRIIGDNADFLDDLLSDFKEGSEEKTFLEKYIDTQNGSNPDIDIISEEIDEGIDTRRLLKDYLSRPNLLNNSGNLNTDIEGIFSSLEENISEQTETLVRQQRRETKGQELSVVMRAVSEDIIYINSLLSDRIDLDTFKSEEFDYELTKANKELKDLSSNFEKIQKK